MLGASAGAVGLGLRQGPNLVALAGGVGGDLRAETPLHLEPSLSKVFGDAVRVEDFAEQGQATLEMAAEDRVRTMGLADGTTAVAHAGAEVLGRVLVFEALDSVTVRSPKVEADHDVVETAVDEAIDDRAQNLLAAEPFEVGAHRSSMER